MPNRDFFRRRLGLADEVAAPTLARLRHPKTLRRLLLALGPLAVLAGGLFAYTAGGRYVSTDNAYVHAGKLTVATDVSGIVADVAVKESQKVEKGQVLFALDQEPFRITLAGAEANLGIVRNQLVTLQATWRQKQAQVAQAKTDAAFYETGFQRQQDLLKRGVASQAAYDQAKRDLELAGQVTPFNDALAALAPGRIWDMATTLGRAALNAEVTKQAMVVAYANDFKLMMVVALALAALPLIFLLKRSKAQPGEVANVE